MRILRRLALLVLVGISLPGLCAPDPATGVPEYSRIVMLHGGDARSLGQMQADAAFRQVVTEGRTTRVEIYNEDLDLTRFPGPAFEDFMLDLLRLKYGSRPPNIVVAYGAVALAFAERHHDRLWPRAALLFMAVDEREFRNHAHPRANGGTTLHLAAARTLELGLALRPATKRVLVVSGVAELDRIYLRAARAELAPFAGRIDVEYLTDVPLAEMMRRVRGAPPDSLIMPISVFRDSTGQSYLSANVVSTLAEAAVAPVLAISENYLGRRILGGVAIRFGDQGRQAGELAAAILDGGDASSLPVKRPGSVCMVDWRELRRWDIAQERVPEGCEVRYREYSYWEQNRGTILATGAIILLQALLISYLVLQHRQRRLAEIEAQRQRSQLAHAARLATVGELTASIAHEINQPLGAILSNADAAEILLESPNPDLAEVRQILADIRRDDERASAVIQRLRALLARHELDRRRLDPNTVVREAVALISQEADRRGTRLIEDLSSSVPAVQGDRVHLVQVLIVLLINAIDAMDGVLPSRRRVVVSTNVADAMVEIAVKDSGPGIPAADFSRLFDSFFTTKAKGMGLGLSIARTIVEAHGGRIWAENITGGGALFRFQLAMAK